MKVGPKLSLRLFLHRALQLDTIFMQDMNLFIPQLSAI